MNAKTLSEAEEIAEVEIIKERLSVLDSPKVRNKEALYKVAEAIENHPRQFDMGMTTIPDSRYCGTAGCIAGFAAMLYPEAVRDKEGNKTDTTFDELELCEILGMTLEETTNLFWDIKNKNGRKIVYDSVTPSIAAATVRRFAETGEIYFDVEG